jgi:hypothetical protein
LPRCQIVHAVIGMARAHLFELAHDDNSCFVYRKGLPNHMSGSHQR